MIRVTLRRTRGIACLLIGLLLRGPAGAAEPPVTALAFTPDGKSLVAASQSGLAVFTWPDLKRQQTIKMQAANPHCLAFSPAGKRLAVGGGNPSEKGSVEIFSWPAGTPAAVFEEHTDSVGAVVWQDPSKLLTASIDREIKRWDLKQTGALFTYQGHSRSVAALCLLADRQTLVSAGDDQSLRVWNLQTGEVVRTLNQHTAPVNALALRPAEGGLPMVASSARDRTIRFWQPTIGRMARYIRLESEPLDIAWLHKGPYVAAACADGRIRIVDADAVKVRQVVPAIDGWAYAIAVHPDGTLAVGGSDGRPRRIVVDGANKEADQAPSNP